jgi:hypothetical protein
MDPLVHHLDWPTNWPVEPTLCHRQRVLPSPRRVALTPRWPTPLVQATSWSSWRTPTESTDPACARVHTTQPFLLSLSHLAISSAIFRFWLVILLHSQLFCYSELNHSPTVNSIILTTMLSHFMILSVICDFVSHLWFCSVFLWFCSAILWFCPVIFLSHLWFFSVICDFSQPFLSSIILLYHLWSCSIISRFCSVIHVVFNSSQILCCSLLRGEQGDGAAVVGAGEGGERGDGVAAMGGAPDRMDDDGRHAGSERRRQAGSVHAGRGRAS